MGFQSQNDPESSELVAVVDDLLNQLSGKFSNLSSELIGKSGTLRLDLYHVNADG